MSRQTQIRFVEYFQTEQLFDAINRTFINNRWSQPVRSLYAGSEPHVTELLIITKWGSPNYNTVNFRVSFSNTKAGSQPPHMITLDNISSMT